MAEEAERMAMGGAANNSDTFLTDMMFKDKPKPPKPNTKPNLSAKGGRRADTDLKKDQEQQDKESAIDSDEYQDMEYDIEYGK